MWLVPRGARKAVSHIVTRTRDVTGEMRISGVVGVKRQG